MSQSRIKVYTKTGDKGTSSLFSGERRAKDDIIFEALGQSDELNAYLGLCVVECKQNHQRLCEMLVELQSRLLDVGSNIATPESNASEGKLKRVALPEGMTDKVESWIDELDQELPPLKNFILPGGSRSSATLHVARTICRRMERTLWDMQKMGNDVDEEVLKFSNRLSDWCFVAARYACMKDGVQENVYKKT